MAAAAAAQKPAAAADLVTRPGADTVKLRQHAEGRRTALLEIRNDEIPDWRQVAEYTDPSRGRFDQPGAGGSQRVKRNKRSRKKIINSKATTCLRVAVAGMSSHMTSKARPWFKVATPVVSLRDLMDVRVWLDDVTMLLRDTLEKSNFYKAMPVAYTEDMMFGIGCMLIAEDVTEVARFHVLTAGTFAIGLDDAGRVDTLWRCYTKSARQLVEKYGEAGLPETIRTAAKSNNPDQLFTVECLIEPNPDAMPGIGPLGIQAPRFRPYREITWIHGGNGEAHGILAIGGHYERPFVAFRFNPAGDDVYSAAPLIDSLGDIKQLQYLEGKKLQLIDAIADPPLNIPEAMRNIGASMMPGSKNYMPATQNQQKVEPTHVPQPDAVAKVAMEIREVENRIEQALFYDLFLMLQSLGDQTGRTATEIAERKEEKATVLGPTLEAITDEGLDPIVVRVFRMLERAGRVPPPPEALRAIPLKVEYTSILAQAMKAAGISGIERTAGFVANMAQSFGPDALDKFNADQAIDEYNERTGAPASIMRDDDTVAAIREGRAQQQRQAQMAALAKPAADGAQAIATLNKAVPEDGSLGQQLADQLAGVAA